MHITLPSSLVILLATTTTVFASSPTVVITVSTPLPTSTSYLSNKDFQNVLLSTHNFFRAEHNVSALVWNDTLATYAAKWAKGCVFKHSGGPYGENLAAGYGNATAAVEGWGNERQAYDFKKPTGFSEKTGHFTQVVWANTTSVGCGKEACGGENGTPGYNIVCEYFPRGNIGGNKNQYYKDNVKAQVKGKNTDTIATGVTKTSTATRSATVTHPGFRLGVGILCIFGVGLLVL